MTDETTQTASPLQFAGMDAAIPFQVEPLDVRGRAVQLGPLLDQIFDRHQYPQAVNKLLAEAITLTVLLGTTLKFDGKFILQTKTDGPVPMIVVDFKTPQSVRAYAQFDSDKISELEKSGDAQIKQLLGTGILAMTIDQGQYTQRYQGIVELDGIGFEEVARRYFRQSEQIPTEVRLAVSEILTRQDDGQPSHNWIAGGLMVQFLPDSEERMRLKDLPGGDGGDEDSFEEDDAWSETLALMNTIDDVELTDPSIEPERLLYRLFHEHGTRVSESTKVVDDCSCSNESIRAVLSNFNSEQISDSVEDGQIRVTCEFCSKKYSFMPDEFN